MIAGVLVVSAWLTLAQAAGVGNPGPELDDIKRLYVTASYEEALTRLTALDGRHDRDEIDQYRALCLIGLGRVGDAEQVLEDIVLRSPEFRVSPQDASPAFLNRFSVVRKRVLPIAANRMFSTAKSSYDVKDFQAAAGRLQKLLSLLKAEPPGDPTLTNLQQMAEGFLRLTEAELAVAGRVVYTALDSGVKPPVEIERRIPAWTPPAQYAWRSFRGVVEVVIDEEGRVESARLAQSLADFYDAQLLESAHAWRFRPALRNDQPVKYRKLVEITMRPRQ